MRSALLNVMINAAFKAGKTLKRDFGEVENLQVSLKGPADFVSIADKRAESTLFEELNKARPNYSFMGEETGMQEGSDKSHTWFVDPLDGTTNFLHGIPHFAISIGLQREGEIVAGVIYNPVTEELYFAEKGSGAFGNDRRLRVSGRRDPTQSLVICGLPHLARGDHLQFRKELALVQARYAGVRRFGACSLDLAYVAAGRADAYWERGLMPWDLAAGLLLIKESGGFASDCDGQPNPLMRGDVCVGNEVMHQDLLGLLAKANN